MKKIWFIAYRENPDFPIYASNNEAAVRARYARLSDTEKSDYIISYLERK